MGNTDSAQQLGERVITARRRLEEDKKVQEERALFFKSKSTESIKVMIESIDKAFDTCAPFLESVLLLAWKFDPERCKNIVLKSCKKVLKAPIIKSEYQWFTTYVFSSSIWMFETKPNRFMYQELLEIANNMSKDITSTMDNIYKHLTLHWKWNELMNIKNQTVIARQDHKRVALLQEKGIRDVLDAKDDNIDDMKTFIDSNVAVNILTTTAKNIDKEFQNHVQTAMNRYGSVAAGPIKKVDRCQSKLENDYQSATFPKAAKLLDLVRCSVTFNTLQQLIDGYNGLISHIDKNSEIIELARVKNGFLDATDGGYRDIKVNVVYHSQLDMGVSMVCEIQLLLAQYLHEKKRVHKLYNVLRQNEYFKMVVTDDYDESKTQLKDIKDIKLTPVLNMKKDVTMTFENNVDTLFRCCTDSESKLIVAEAGHHGSGAYGCIDMNTKKLIWQQKTTDLGYNNRHTCNWININNQRYLSVKTSKNSIKMFRVAKDNNGSYSFEEDEKFSVNLSDKEDIMFCEFDRDFQNIFILKNGDVLEKRLVNNISVVKKSIKLEQKVKDSWFNQLSLSNDGNFCVLAGDTARNAYFIDIANDKQIQLKLNKQTTAPCFINGEPKLMVVGESHSINIWDVVKQEVVKKIDMGAFVRCTTSTGNILAVGTGDERLRLYDVRNWEMFYSQQYQMKYGLNSIHLTSDSKYVTIGGDSQTCVVLQIQ